MKGEQNRDRAIERLLRETRIDRAPSQSCLDGESLAALSDGTLSPAAARAIEIHASECARCQSMLAAFARAEPGPLVPAEPFWHRWRLQWLVPAAAMATALSVWVAVPRDRPRPSATVTANNEQPSSLRAMPSGTGLADRAAPAEAPALPSSADGQQGARGDMGRQQGGQPRGLAAGREVDGTLDKAGPQREERREAESKAVNQSPEPPDRLASADAGPSDARPEQTEPSAAAVDKRERSIVAPSKDAASPPAVPAPSPAIETGSSTKEALSLPSRFDRVTSVRLPFDVASPDGVHRWRTDAGGQLQHSSSAGATWQSVSIPASEILTAGTSPEASVCWIVGRNGAVWLTTDGARFDRRSVAAPVDLISVRSTDARHAIVGAADGRTFLTADGGVTWAPAAP